jgi:hypothetical protein
MLRENQSFDAQGASIVNVWGGGIREEEGGGMYSASKELYQGARRRFVRKRNSLHYPTLCDMA